MCEDGHEVHEKVMRSGVKYEKRRKQMMKFAKECINQGEKIARADIKQNQIL